jgi:acyl-CoA thioester hydrolase
LTQLAGKTMSNATTTRIRVLYVDTDQMGVVNGGNYIRWFEAARAEWLRERACTYKALEDLGFRIPLTESRVVYRAPARYDDLVDVCTWPSGAWAASTTFRYTVSRVSDELLLCYGLTRHACLDQDGKVCRFPLTLQTKLRESCR